AITKGEKFDLVVQKAVELGVWRMVPLYTARCEVKPGGSEKRLDRWRKIALEAAKQTGRARLMAIDEPIDLRKFTDSVITAGDHTIIMFSERGGGDFARIKPTKKITAVIGPAGGWDDSELNITRDRGFTVVTLGGRILRAETAAIAFAALLQHRFGDLN
ncbi:MAG: RsmE family RNA methyltransferase, partial [Pyrinomonadaceae bacterium]